MDYEKAAEDLRLTLKEVVRQARLNDLSGSAIALEMARAAKDLSANYGARYYLDVVCGLFERGLGIKR